MGKRNKYKDQQEEVEEIKEQVLEEHKQEKQEKKNANQNAKAEGAGKATSAILKEVKKLNKDKVDTKDYTQLQQDYMKNLPSVERIRADKDIEIAKMLHEEKMHAMNIGAGLVKRPEIKKEVKKKDATKDKPKKPADVVVAMAIMTGLVTVSLVAVIIVLLLK